MKNNLIILTNKFPYSNGETFFESELPILSKYFDNIYIFSCSKKTINARKMPNNCFAFSLGINSSRFLKFLSFFRISLSIKNLLKFKPKSFKEVISFGLAIFCKKKIIKIISKNGINNFDTIYSYWFNFITTAAILISEEFSKTTNKPKTISRAHGVDVYEYRHKSGVVPCQLYNISNVDIVSCVSLNGQAYLSRKYPLYRKKVIVSKLGTKHSPLMHANKSLTQKYIVTCSSLNKIKRLNLLAESMSYVCEKLCVKWICIGAGDELENIKSIINKNGLTDNVVFMGSLSNSEVLDYYSKHYIDLFVNVSSSEGLPVSIMEAMSFGIPVLATDVGGTSEIVDSSNGDLVEKDITPTQLAKRIVNLLNSDLAKKRESAFSTWRNNYCAETNYTNWCQILRGVKL